MKHFIVGLVGSVLTLAALVGSDALYQHRAYSPEYMQTDRGLVSFEVHYHGWRPLLAVGEGTIVLWRQRIRVPWPNSP